MSDHLPECIALAVRMEYDDTFCICPEVRACEARVFAHITELLNRQKITHAELIGPQYPVLIEVSRVEAAIKEASDE